MKRVPKNKTFSNAMAKFNRISIPTNILFSIIFVVLSITCILPLFFTFMISITSEESLAEYGYQLIPNSTTLDAYKYLFVQMGTIGRAFLMSIQVTVYGTIIGLILISSAGYVLSRKKYRWKKFLTMVIFIPMLFNGGLVAKYLINTQLLNIGNTIWVLILPLCVSPFYIIIMRTFFQTTIPDQIIESAKIDGANQLYIYFRMVLPISLPAIATIGLFLSIMFWNDWFSAMLYIKSSHSELYPLQYVLVKLDRNIQFLVQNKNSMGSAAQEAFGDIPTEASRMALVMIVVLPVMCVYPFFQRYFISGLTIGAVKG